MGQTESALETTNRFSLSKNGKWIVCEDGTMVQLSHVLAVYRDVTESGKNRLTLRFQNSTTVNGLISMDLTSSEMETEQVEQLLAQLQNEESVETVKGTKRKRG